MSVDLSIVPEAQREIVRAALDEAFPSGIDSLESGPWGASGAQIYRVRRRSEDALLRIEGTRFPDRNPHQYRNMEAAAAAGIAPPVRFVDDANGVLIMRWLDQQALTTYPQGPDRLAGDVGALIARLQELEPFPPRDDTWANRVSQLLAYVENSGLVAPGLLAEISDGFERVKSVWERSPCSPVAAHNDPNASNLMFDGDRLWLVDWETSGPNDPLIDLGVAANQLAPTRELRNALLEGWHGSRPDERLHARLALAQVAAQVFAGAALALITGQMGAAPIADLDAPTPEEFEQQVIGGSYVVGSPETMAMFSKVVLANVRATVNATDFEAVLAGAAG